MKKIKFTTKDLLITIAIYGSIIIPMFVVIYEPADESQTKAGSDRKPATASPLSPHFVVLKANNEGRLKEYKITYAKYQGDLGVYVDQYPQLLMKDKVILTVGGLNLIFSRHAIKGVATVHDTAELPKAGAVQPLRFGSH